MKSAKQAVPTLAKRRHTIASRLIFLALCVGMVVTTLLYGTVHYWALAAFSLSAAGIVCLWTLDGLVLRSTRLSLNRLQWPILGMIVLGTLWYIVDAWILAPIERATGKRWGLVTS